MVIGLVGCGNNGAAEPVSAEAIPDDSVASVAPEQSQEEETVVYSGTEVRSFSEVWTIEGGYEVELEVDVGEPVRFEEDMPHPWNSERLMTNPEGETEDSCWVVPFRIYAKNLTSGYGAVETKLRIGLYCSEDVNRYCGHSSVIYNAEEGVGAMYANGYDVNWAFYDSMIRDRTARSYCMFCFSDGLGKAGAYEVLSLSVSEGRKKVVYGYFVIIDSKKTPEKPDGVDLSSSMIVGTSSSSIKGVAKFDKNSEGELVFVD